VQGQLAVDPEAPAAPADCPALPLTAEPVPPKPALAQAPPQPPRPAPSSWPVRPARPPRPDVHSAHPPSPATARPAATHSSHTAPAMPAPWVNPAAPPASRGSGEHPLHQSPPPPAEPPCPAAASVPAESGAPPPQQAPAPARGAPAAFKTILRSAFPPQAPANPSSRPEIAPRASCSTPGTRTLRNLPCRRAPHHGNHRMVARGNSTHRTARMTLRRAGRQPNGCAWPLCEAALDDGRSARADLACFLYVGMSRRSPPLRRSPSF
jgi:hypothetical protein